MVTGHDLTKATTSMSGGTFLSNKMGAALSIASYGAIRMVANCGVSGDTTTAFLARDGAASSATRKAMTDAANLGAQIMVVSIGINDIQANITSATTAGATDTFLSGTLYPNIFAILTRIRALGMWPVYQSMGGYNAGSAVVGTAGDISARCAVIKRANSYIQNQICPGLASFADVNAVIADPVTNTHLANMSADGIHPTVLGARKSAEVVWSVIQAKFNPFTRARYALPTYGVSDNCISNATLSASTGGLATNITLTDIGGTTNTVTKAINTYEGIPWQELGVTTGTLDATNTATLGINIGLSIFGGSPVVSFAAGDLIACEADIWVDNGADAAPTNMMLVAARSRMFYAGGASSSFFDTPQSGIAIVDQAPTTAVLRGKMTTIAHAAPDTSANMTNATFTIFTQATVGSYRVRIGNLRAVKLPANY